MKTLKIRTQSFLSIKQFCKDVLTSEQLQISLPAQCFDPNHIPLNKLVDKLSTVLTVNQVDTVFIPVNLQVKLNHDLHLKLIHPIGLIRPHSYSIF